MSGITFKVPEIVSHGEMGGEVGGKGGGRFKLVGMVEAVKALYGYMTKFVAWQVGCKG